MISVAAARRPPAPRDQAREEPVDESIPLKSRLEQVEARMIRGALERYGWKRAPAAKALGLSVRNLGYKMKQYGIKPPEGSER